MQCFVCSEHLQGDAAYQTHHLNACLDRQGSSASQPLATPSTALCTASKSSPPFASPPLSPQLAADAALALALAQDLDAPSTAYNHHGDDRTIERDRLLALSLAQDDARIDNKGKRVAFPAEEDVQGDACPVCCAEWDDRAFSLPPSSAGSSASERVLHRRADHIRACAEEMGRFEEMDEGSAMAGHGLPDQDELGGEVDSGGGGKTGSTGKRGWTGDVGGKDEVRGTVGLVPVLRNALKQSNVAPHGRTKEAWLASAATEHIPTRVKDWGWGCGYKNAQMVFSSLRHLPQYAALFASGSASPMSENGDALKRLTPIPTIHEWQEMIEKAWAAGFDPDGASHFAGKLVDSRRWIGTTEVYVALTWMGIRAHIVDFPKLSGTSSVHAPLLAWLVDYFRSAPPSSTSPTPPAQDAFTALHASGGGAVRITAREPLYLQHKGHSRTVVGVEYGGKTGAGGGGKKGRKAPGEREGAEEEAWLLVFDPGRPVPQELKTAAAALSTSTAASATRTAASPPPAAPPAAKKPKLSPLARGGFGGLAGGAGGLAAPKFDEVLKAVRVNMRELKRKDAYQLLYIDPSEPPLTAQEKARRKVVRSTVVTAP